jgi:hypothetical protein
VCDYEVLGVDIVWDEEGDGWVATSDDRGLVLNSGSVDALIEMVGFAVPDLDVRSIRENICREIIAIDAEAVKGAFNVENGKSLHIIVSTWTTAGQGSPGR